MKLIEKPITGTMKRIPSKSNFTAFEPRDQKWLANKINEEHELYRLRASMKSADVNLTVRLFRDEDRTATIEYYDTVIQTHWCRNKDFGPIRPGYIHQDTLDLLKRHKVI